MTGWVWHQSGSTMLILLIVQKHLQFHWPIVRARTAPGTAEPPQNVLQWQLGTSCLCLVAVAGTAVNKRQQHCTKLCAAELYTNSCAENNSGKARKELKNCSPLLQRSSSSYTSTPLCYHLCTRVYCYRRAVVLAKAILNGGNLVLSW